MIVLRLLPLHSVLSAAVFLCACVEERKPEAELFLLDEDELERVAKLEDPLDFYFQNSFLPTDYEWDGLLDETYLATMEDVRFKTKSGLESVLEQFFLYKFPIESNGEELVDFLHTRDGGSCNSKALKLYSATEDKWRCSYHVRLPYPKNSRPDVSKLSGEEQNYWISVADSAGLSDLSELPAYLEERNFELEIFEIEIDIASQSDGMIVNLDITVGESGIDNIEAASLADLQQQ